ncbi:PadR family transcriptional regulator [Leptolinea sp. HRD-7]|nr:PadR family transcriptional regulator [Leptolinea sp. HRD-7]
MENNEIQKFLPLSESTYYILLSLVESRHGYAIMQHVETISSGTVTIGPGTLYGAFSNLEKAGLIRITGEEDRRKYYQLTALGKQVLAEQIHRLSIMADNGQKALPDLEK